MDIVQFRDLHFAYPEEKNEVLRGVNLTLEEGKFYILCGKSGCGKSTLLRHMKYALAPKGRREGSLRKNVPEEEIGFVFQHPDNQIVTDKVWHELVFGMESLGLDQDTMNLRVAELASYFGVEQWFDKEVSQLSGGQKQLLNLAAVLTLRPRLLLLDEPMAWLDPMAAGEFLHTLYRIQREMGMTVVLSAHQLEEVISYGDEFLLMEEGRIASQGSLEHIGRELRDQGADLYMAMPAPMRIYLQSGSKKECPCTIAQGREWLRQELGEQRGRGIAREEKGTAVAVKDAIEAGGGIAIAEKDAAVAGKTPHPVLRVKGLRYRYPGGDRDILCGTSFQVQRGEILGILGGNGSGKSTLLRKLSGLLPEGGGKVQLRRGKNWENAEKGISEGRIALLPQDVTVIFQEEILDRDLEGDWEEREKWIERFHLRHLLKRHPYDISGGEQQRAALAKLLLRKPDIFLLDEPTKGMDAGDRRILGNALEELAAEGRTILMVSHDLEFTAAYSHRAGLFFRGRLEGLMPARDFFCRNHFYTTAVHRMSREMIPWAITVEDVLVVLSGTARDVRDRGCSDERGTADVEDRANSYEEVDSEARDSGCFVVGEETAGKEDVYDSGESEKFNGEDAYAGGGVVAEPQDDGYPGDGEMTARDQMPSSGGWGMACYIAGIFLLYPALIWVGMAFFHDRRYLLISLGMVVYALLPFFSLWEKRPPRVQKLVVLAVIAAVAVAGRCAFYMFPSVKPMAAVAIVAGVSLGAEGGFFVGALSMLASNMMFGQGPWTPWQMLAMGLVGFFAGVLMHGRKFRKAGPWVKRIAMALYGLVGVLCLYGGIMNPASLLMAAYEVNRQNLVAIYLSGLPMDLVHGGTTALLLLAAGVPMLKTLERMKKKYDLE